MSCLRFVEHAGHVGEQQQALGLERAGDGAGEGIGIDVEGAAVCRRGDRRQHRNQLAAEDLGEHGGIDLLRLADKAEVDDLLDRGIGVDHGARQLARHHHVAVLAAEPDRLAAGFVDVADHLLVDGAGQHHLDDFERFFVGDAQARRVLRLHADFLEHGLDLRSAAVNDDRIDRGLLQKHDIAGEFARQILRAHGVAAVFDNDGFLVVALHIGQGFRKNAGLLERRHVH